MAYSACDVFSVLILYILRVLEKIITEREGLKCLNVDTCNLVLSQGLNIKVGQGTLHCSYVLDLRSR